ncbi:RNA cytidine acetyltransferase, partial [Dictyocoela roeselum]
TEPDQCAFNKIFDLTKTDDQRHVLKSITRDMSDANFISIITSNRGRGKSATLGLLVAIAINRNFKKIQILAPFAENVQIIFKFVKFGLECLGFQENCDFESDELKPNFQTASKTKLTKKITFRKKQVVEYVSPGSSKCLFSSNNDFNDLLVIDEAAAIPPALLYDKIRNNGCVFIATTTSGYEGTGQFFSTKLLHFLQYLSSGKYKGNVPNIRFYSLYEPIRYSFSDPAEKFLFDTLFLKNDAPPNQDTLIPIENYDLHHVNMDILVKYKHKSDGHLKPDTPNSGLDSIPVPEQILQAITQLLASSHYRNSPDDMFQLIENPNHHLFLLLSENEENILQRMVCAVHVIIEKENTKIGNLLKNTISDHYDIDKLSDFVGLRIFRIAVHPDFQHKGFGSLAIKKLIKFVDNSNISSLTTIPGQKNIHQNENNDVLFDNKGPVLPFIEYIGVSFGFDHNLYDFWSKNGFWPLYLHHRQNEVSGAYSIIMIHCKGADFHSNEDNWVKNINLIFKRRLIGMLGFYFKEFKTEYVWRLIKSPDCTKNKALLIYESKDKLTPKNTVLNFNADEKGTTTKLRAVSHVSF